MLRKLLTVVLNIFIVLSSFFASCLAQEITDEKAMESFKKTFPGINAESIRKTDINGIYEVSVPGKILYYFLEKDYLFVGSIWDSHRKNLTARRESEIVSEKVKKLSLEKALKIGKGERVIVEFTNPDCPFCREASTLLSKQTNLVRYVFFVPLAMHKDTEQKIKYIFCEHDKEKAYEEVMGGKFDNKKVTICNDEKVNALLNEHKNISNRIGINSTPQFWINGKHVQGADIPLIEQLLDITTKEPEK